ncbi:MAG: RNA-binding transcriptional accessory protein [Candidatus Schekmanbacteria bacterium]|nr:RNA-binding transcriptional accessory protein [Candidatus Schekmanbacteria bacterium]
MPLLPDPIEIISTALTLPRAGVAAVVQLLNAGATVPFIARYRKEVTGSLDEVQIRAIQERVAYLIELEERRTTILDSITAQGKLTPELAAQIAGCDTKAALEDVYLPYKPKRRTRATIARERGLEPLAMRILEQSPAADPDAEAATYVDAVKDVPDSGSALAGARDIVAEIVAERAEVRATVRTSMARDGVLVSAAVPDATAEPTKFEQYYDFREPLATIPSHRYLAIQRGERDGVLRSAIELDTEALISSVLRLAGMRRESPYASHLEAAVRDGFKRLLLPSVESDVRVDAKMQADRDAVDVFASNLRSVLMAAPLGERSVVGIDPGLRTGCKSVAVDATGKFLETITIYPTIPGGVERARADLLRFLARHKPYAVAVGNGTGGRETFAFVREILAAAHLDNVITVQVNEAGASVYSASDIAREEFPDLDLTIRGAISIARRLQDPLAELVKLDPKAIGVGQYQHDVHQPLLHRKLEEVVESCVNLVGVELNTASAPLLARVSGIGPALARKVVRHRETAGAFRSRRELLDVSGLGPRTFEQAAGFLRVANGEHPLDASAVHPERYELVERMAVDLGVAVGELVGGTSIADRIPLERYVGADVGLPTLRDIVAELKKPGRDPRDAFEAPRFRDDVREIADLQPGMVLEGVVTNVTNFGAFVDIGVHQDGLVHISQLADRFVKDPSEVVQAGQKIRVRVLEVDLARRRIALSARSEQSAPVANERSARAEGAQRPPRDGRGGGDRGGGRDARGSQPAFRNRALASQLKRQS